jgi:hypothetical protein
MMTTCSNYQQLLNMLELFNFKRAELCRQSNILSLAKMVCERFKGSIPVGVLVRKILVL